MGTPSGSPSHPDLDQSQTSTSGGQPGIKIKLKLMDNTITVPE